MKPGDRVLVPSFYDPRQGTVTALTVNNKVIVQQDETGIKQAFDPAELRLLTDPAKWEKQKVTVRTKQKGYLAFEFSLTEQSERLLKELMADGRYLVSIDGATACGNCMHNVHFVSEKQAGSICCRWCEQKRKGISA